MIEAELRDHLVANVLSVDGRVYPVLLPQNPEYPALTYQLVSDPRQHSLDGPDGLVEARYQVTPWSQLYSEVKAAREEVRLALEGFNGQWGVYPVSAIDHAGGVDLYDPDVEVYHSPTDFIVRYAES